MKKSIIILSLSLFPIMGIFAQSETQQVPTRQNILRERIEKQRTNYMQNLQEAREIGEQYREAKSPEERAELREKAREGFVLRFTNAVERLTLMQEQTQERINLAESRGFDVAEAQSKLTESRNYLSITISTYQELKTLIENNPAENKEEAKKLFETIKENFSLSRQSLIDSIQNLKQSVIGSIQENNNGSEENTADINTVN
jgi:hypothetical protein